MRDQDGPVVMLALGNDELATMSDDDVRAQVAGFLEQLTGQPADTRDVDQLAGVILGRRPGHARQE